MSIYPLSGVRVVDFTTALAGPYATMILADLGADVVKVEPPSGDQSRDWGPPFYLDKYSAYFVATNRGKRSVVIDLRREEGREVVYRLVKTARVVIENFRPGVAARLGVDFTKLVEINPNIIYVSISGFGQSGPYRDLAGYDMIAQAMSGLMDLTGEPDGPPLKFGVPISDMVAGMYAVISILAALYAGIGGVYVDISLLESDLTLLIPHSQHYFASGRSPRREGNTHPYIAPYGAFRARDGYVVICCGTQKLWEELCRALGKPELLNDPRFLSNSERVKHLSELKKVIEDALSKESVDYWVRRLREVGIPAAPIYTVAQALTNEHVLHRGAIREVRHKLVGNIKLVGTPIKYVTKLTAGNYIAPPLLGEHTLEVLKELGYTDEEINKLINDGVVYALRG